jgi:copper chaperone CopZ
MPSVRRKFPCGHKAHGKECPVCKDIELGCLETVNGQLRSVSVVEHKKREVEKKAAEDLEKRSVKINGKAVDTAEIQKALTSKAKTKKI